MVSSNYATLWCWVMLCQKIYIKKAVEVLKITIYVLIVVQSYFPQFFFKSPNMKMR